MKKCSHHESVSPENAACAWCGRYRINLDRAGRLCARCLSDDAFRAMLERRTVLRFGHDCGESAYCEPFRTATDEAQCERCKRDPEFRQFLYGQFLAARRGQRAQPADCPHRGEVIRVELRGCCGGSRRTLAIHRCAVHGEAHEGVCAGCDQAVGNRQ